MRARMVPLSVKDDDASRNRVGFDSWPFYSPILFTSPSVSVCEEPALASGRLFAPGCTDGRDPSIEYDGARPADAPYA